MLGSNRFYSRRVRVFRIVGATALTGPTAGQAVTTEMTIYASLQVDISEKSRQVRDTHGNIILSTHRMTSKQPLPLMQADDWVSEIINGSDVDGSTPPVPNTPRYLIIGKDESGIGADLQRGQP